MKSVIKSILGENFIQGIYHTKIKITEKLQYKFLYPIVLAIPFAQNFYFLFSKSFGSEMQMFVDARRDYLQKKYAQKDNLFLLRRNIHRLEKGLIMKNRRAVFALDYIEETVSLLKNLVISGNDNEQIQWAFDILTQYFEVTDSAKQIDNAHREFKTLSPIKHTAESFIPYPKTEKHQEIDESFYALVKNRKSVRFYDPNRIPDRSLMDKAVDMAGMAPSSCNRQPFCFRIIDDPELVKKMAHLPGGTKGFADEIVAMVAVVGQMNVSPSLSDRHLMYIDGSLAAMNFMLALESMGISSCPLNWPEMKSKDQQVRTLLSLSKHERPIMMIAYGYAEDKSQLACSVRKPLEQLRTYN